MQVAKRGLGGLGLALLVWSAAPAPARAEPLDALVLDERGEPVQDAVVYALPMGAETRHLAPPGTVEIDQVNKEYVPYLTAIRVGTRVRFPNHDQIRHHVYSFSAAKTFEIPLYKGTPPDPVVFDKPGEVVLGCNIHDWMRAYVFVSETPYFAVTDADGAARLDLPAGEYAVQVWHPELAGEPEATRQDLRVGGGEPLRLRFSIEQKRVWRPRRAPSMDDPSYR
jgi:plastocyanin